ncbi:MAG: hypothetical protein N4A57_09165 [Anaeromicrobium sp.]|jgi:hypothetical protein|nr:hypothetical protein [Anaeromicrobium sp.]MCT4594422.1 hypothetical protein [Anaeromicrobium sp.]
MKKKGNEPRSYRKTCRVVTCLHCINGKCSFSAKAEDCDLYEVRLIQEG